MRRVIIMGWLALLAGLFGCDTQRLAELEVGRSTEADVRQRMGEPQAVWDEPDGSRTFEYSRQPEGSTAYMLTLSPSGTLTALRQVLTAETFARIQPGMPMEQVRRMLGRPMQQTPYALKGETHWDWRYQDGPAQSDQKIFTVVFDSDFRVRSTGSVVDPSPPVQGR